MANSFHLKLNQPKELPAEGITSVQFKPWQNHLKNFLQQDINNFRFLPGGENQKWKAASTLENGERIYELNDNDDDLKLILASDDNVGTKTLKRKSLRRKRNAELAKMIQHIVSFVHYTEADDIDQESTSLEWIFSHLKQHYGIQVKGANFLKIADHVYKPGTLHQVFYKMYRASFLNNLRKSGEKMTHKGGAVMNEDETLSPSFEDAIVMWSLALIDKRLPKKVKKDYEHWLTGDTYLIDLQPTIFQSIPSLLEDLDRQVDSNALMARSATEQEDPSLNAVRPFSSRGKPPFSRDGRRVSFRGRSDQNTSARKFCRVCQTAGKPSYVVKSHNVGTCGFFDRQDRKDMLASLQAMSMEDQQVDDEAWSIEEEELEKKSD